MSRIVLDTDVASYIYNHHSLARRYVAALLGHSKILSFMSVAEMRTGSLSAQWGARRRGELETYISTFEVVH